MTTTCSVCGTPLPTGAAPGGSATCPGCVAPPAPAAPAPVPSRRPPVRSTQARAGEQVRERPADLAVGQVFGQTLSLWTANLGSFLLLTTLVYLPLLAFTAWLVVMGPEEATIGQMGIHEKLHQYGGILLNSFVTAVVVYFVFERLRGRSPALGMTVRKGLGRLLPTLWTSIFSAVLYLAPMAPGFLLMSHSMEGAMEPGSGPSSGTLILGVVLVFGGMIVSMVVLTAFFVGIPASVVEGCNGWPALKRSLALTKGSKSRIFSVLFLFGILGGVYGWAVTGFAPWRLAMVLNEVYMVLLASGSAVFSTVIYYRLRAAKEGIGIEELAGVFD